MPDALGTPLSVIMAADLAPVPAHGDLAGDPGPPLYVAGRGGIAALVPQRAAVEVWHDLAALGEHAAALGVIEEAREDLEFAALEAGDAAGAAGGVAARRLEAAEAQIRFALARAACGRGALHSPALGLFRTALLLASPTCGRAAHDCSSLPCRGLRRCSGRGRADNAASG